MNSDLKDSWMKMVRSQTLRSWCHSQLVSSWVDPYEFRTERFFDENDLAPNTEKLVQFLVGSTWGNPCEFRPERFLDENGQVTNTEKLVPFFVGKFLGRSL